jgi:hypothetical protein
VLRHRLPIGELRERSANRVSAEPEFQYLREDLENHQRILAANRVSLNESARRAAFAEDKARLEQRETERAERKPLLPQKTVCISSDEAQISASGHRKRRPAANSATRANSSLAPADEAVDPMREESLNILSDLIGLSRANRGVASAI